MTIKPERLCVIFDVDGTLTNNEHRSHYLQQRPKDWESFNNACHLDAPQKSVIVLAKVLRQHYALILATGRMEKQRDKTQEWLTFHDIQHDGLFMRQTDDFRVDSVVKQELLAEIRQAGFEPVLVVDDRASVVKMWREAGLLCLQCAEGDF